MGPICSPQKEKIHKDSNITSMMHRQSILSFYQNDQPKAQILEFVLTGKNLSLGKCNYSSKQFLNLLQNEFEGKAMKQFSNQSLKLSEFYTNIGCIFSTFEEFSKAEKYFQRAYELILELISEEKEINGESIDEILLEQKGIALSNLAFIFYKLEKIEKALEYSLASVAIREQLIDFKPDRVLAYQYNSIGTLMKLLFKSTADSYFEKSYDMWKIIFGEMDEIV